MELSSELNDQTNNEEQTGDQEEKGEEIMSKNQRKRLRKQEMWQIAKVAKRQRQKEKKRELSEARRLEREQQKAINAEALPPIISKKPAKEKRETMKIEYLEAVSRGITIIIDCSWQDQHNESTLKSLTQQIMYCYGCNRKHSHPAQLYLTGLGTRMKEQLSKVLYKNWTAVESSDMDYVDLPQFTKETLVSDDVVSEAVHETKKKQLVYLTSDADDVIDQLDNDCAYIIGGIVDRNRHKGATLLKAQSQGVRTAKLPIKENFELSATHVLTVNHVFEILLNFTAVKCWRTAIEQVLPKRKGVKERDDAADAEDDSESSHAHDVKDS